MQKKLLSLAVCGLLSGTAFGQTANVTLYGRLNTTFENVRGGTAAVSTNRVSSNGSRWGIKGEESLGSNLTAIFQVETGFNSDAGAATGATSSIGNRDTFVGMRGDFGQVRLGNFHSPYDNTISPYVGSNFYSNGIAYASALFGNCGGGKARAAAQSASNNAVCFDNRYSNSVRYDTPNLQGFVGSVQYSVQKEDPANSQQKASTWIFGGEYKNGPFSVATGYIRNDKLGGPELEDSAFSLTGAYKEGPIFVAMAYERLRYDVTTSSDLKRDYFGITGAYTLNGNLKLQSHLGMAGKGKGSAAQGTQIGGIVIGNDTEAKLWNIGADYAFSKRTSLYAYYAKIFNGKNAAYNFSVNPVAGLVAGNKPSGVVLGVKHDF